MEKRKSKNYHTPDNSQVPSDNQMAISVIIPLYNAEEYVAGCLDSILAQTFQDFELIIVDDCSTDSSCSIVESYILKFNGRLKLYHTKKNTGSGVIARNIGFSYSTGKYIFNMDNDDRITKTALEELYNLAKEYDADVVYCEKYFMSKGSGQNFEKNMYPAYSRVQKPPFVDKPTLEPQDLSERIQEIVDERFWVAPWQKLVRRDLLNKYKILFPILRIGDDDIWTYELIFVAKKFLRVPNMIYIRNMRETSISNVKKTPQQTIKFWLNPILLGLKELDTFMNKIEFFKENPHLRYTVFEQFFYKKFLASFRDITPLSLADVYETIKNEFGQNLGEYDVLISALCTHICRGTKTFLENKQKIKDADSATQAANRRIAEQNEEIQRLKNKINLMSSLPVQNFICPEISVIVPIYNKEKYIDDCLDSLRVQTFQNFEVIVIDDCSTDSTMAIVESYVPKFEGRLKIFKLKEKSVNENLPRRKGLELSLGKYVLFLNADDAITATALDELYKIAEEFGADVVHCEKFYRVPDEIWKDKIVRSKLKPDNHFTSSRLNVTSPTLLSDDINKRVQLFAEEKLIWNLWSQLIRRDFIAENEILNLPYAAAQDMLFTMCSLCCAEKYVVVPNAINFYRAREESLSAESVDYGAQLKKFLNLIRANIEYLDKFFAKHVKLSDRADLKYTLFDTLMKQALPDLDLVYSNISSAALDEVFQKEFSNGSNKAFAACIFRMMNNYRFQLNNSQKDIPTQAREFKRLISVIIPLYNAEKYIGECLDSVLVQTFKDFEVIVVDDCSTDKSSSVVESYIPKFDGRLRLTKTAQNTGSPGEPNNIGVALSRGEYLFIMDDDDTITPDALEKLYNDAKNFDADVVTCEKFYRVPEESWHDENFRKNLKPYSYKQGGLVTKPTLIPFDVAQRVKDCYDRKFLWSLWQKLIRRDFLIENEIHFTSNVTQDIVATCCLAYTAERFVCVPYAINFYRSSMDTLYHQKLEPLQKLKTYLSALNVGFTYLNKFLSKKDFFQKNPDTKQLALNTYLKEIWEQYIREIYDKIPALDREDVLREEFTGEGNTALTAFFSYVSANLIAVKQNAPKPSKAPNEFNPNLTARIDFKLIPKTKGGNFELLSVSDDSARIIKPGWLKRGEVGHVINSYAGNVKFAARATAEGKIQFDLRSLDIRDKLDNSKHVPHLIDYNKLIINGKTIFDKLTPAWHDEPYTYLMDVKAGEEIKVQVEWLPHRDKPTEQNVPTIDNVKPNAPTIDNVKPNAPTTNIIEQDSKSKALYAPFKSKRFNARVDVKLMSTAGDLKILSVSDERARVKKPSWFQVNGVGYQVEYRAEQIDIIAKATVNGLIEMRLRGISVSDPKDKSKRLPYWVDYSKLVVNEMTIFDKLTPTWHDEPYIYSIYARAEEEIKIHIEWTPHESDK